MEKKRFDIRPKRYAVLINLLVIIIIAIVGIAIAYFSTAVFTKHGEEATVPKVENMSYTKAVQLLHSKGFNVDIRDSLFRDDVKPGFVIEQFPKANSIVKPGRKVFLYINAVHPKEVVIDDSGEKGALALKDWSYRQVRSRLTELGFKNVRTITVLGADDRVVKILANGKPIYQMQKVPVNATLIIEVSDGRLAALRDSLYDSERINLYPTDFGDFPGGENLTTPNRTATSAPKASSPKPAAPAASTNVQETTNATTYEEPEYFEIHEESSTDD